MKQSLNYSNNRRKRTSNIFASELQGVGVGFEYIFDSVSVVDDDDIVIDYGKLKFVVNKLSVPI